MRGLTPLRACSKCGRVAAISQVIGLCKSCLTGVPEGELASLQKGFRSSLGLSHAPPREEGGKACGLCVNECILKEGSTGYCGVRANVGGSVVNVAGAGRALAVAYYDRIPTNCVAAELCPATTGAGYPKFAVSPSGEEGCYNLAVFFYGCNLSCLFCQNIEHKYGLRRAAREHLLTEEVFLRMAAPERVTCVCFFGGDPTPHSPEAIRFSRRLLELSRGRGAVKRVCWETNGLASPEVAGAMARLSLESGGIVKVDWKAWTPGVYTALTGVSGEKALKRLKENARMIWGLGRERIEIPLLVVSTLLVPGYVDEEEVEGIASFLASLSEDIPYVLLAFYPRHLMADMPTTSRSHAERCVRAAKRAGLKRVLLGNAWLLSSMEY